jgi:uncharacterized protein YbbC (DUF1343 family)
MKNSINIRSFLLVFSALNFSFLLPLNAQVLPGAFQTEIYFPLLKNKRVAVFANQTSTLGNTHLVDTLVKSGITVSVIFGPEHGFRGTADAGEKIDNAIDKKTGIKVISLYGNHKKPTADDLKDVDIMLFDIQDVGVRFYTFISSLEYYIEAAIEQQKKLIILDRPNPHRHYIDGPILDMKYKSFVGMQPIPVVYGMTIGEYAYMITKENMLGSKPLVPDVVYQIDNITKLSISTMHDDNVKNLSLNLHIITCKNYNSKSRYDLPVAPSPNLKQMQSIVWYPSTCFFEGTVLSEGRGTDYPFQIFGHPSLPKNLYKFTPNPNAGAKSSKLFGQECYGWYLQGSIDEAYNKINSKIQLNYLLQAYKLFPNKDSFFLEPKDKLKPENYFFNKLAGNQLLMQQIKAGKSEKQIRKSWKKGLKKFNAIRKKYLLYE